MTTVHPLFINTAQFPPSNADKFENLPPSKSLKIEYIYGSSRKGCNGRFLHLNDDGDLVYPAAACGVVLDVEQNTQQIFSEHDDDLLVLAKQ